MTLTPNQRIPRTGWDAPVSVLPTRFAPTSRWGSAGWLAECAWIRSTARLHMGLEVVGQVFCYGLCHRWVSQGKACRDTMTGGGRDTKCLWTSEMWLGEALIMFCFVCVGMVMGGLNRPIVSETGMWNCLNDECIAYYLGSMLFPCYNGKI